MPPVKIHRVILSTVVVCLTPLLFARAQQVPAKWGPGCNKALLEGEFSLAKAPEIACTTERKAYIDNVIAQEKSRTGTLTVLEDSLHPHMDSPEFTAFFLRAFADPGLEINPRDNFGLDPLIGRFASGIATAQMLKDARLDWDIWRAWLLFENTAHTKDAVIGTVHLTCAREVLWAYLSVHAREILKDPQRRAWWLTRLTAGMEAPGGRPQRRWFLLLLLTKEDPKREALEKIPGRRVYSIYGNQVLLRQPRPLDPFLLLNEKKPYVPAFRDAVTQMALNSNLALTVLGIDPDAQPPTRVDNVNLLGAFTKAGDEANIIYQESWSTPPADMRKFAVFRDYEWGRTLRFAAPREYYGEIILPEDRTDGVYFFVYNQRLYVWPKAKMDAGVIHLLRTADLIDSTAAAKFEKNGLGPLKETLVKEAAGK
jgi:hypothetical protein